MKFSGNFVLPSLKFVPYNKQKQNYPLLAPLSLQVHIDEDRQRERDTESRKVIMRGRVAGGFLVVTDPKNISNGEQSAALISDTKSSRTVKDVGENLAIVVYNRGKD